MRRTAYTALLAMAAATVLAACGSGTAIRSTTPAAVHTAEPGEPALIQVYGYQYEDTEPSRVENVQASMNQTNDAMPGTYASASLHEVVTAGAGDMAIAEYQLGQKYTEMIGESLPFASGSVAAMAGPGVSVKTEEISTQPVASASFNRDGHHWMVFAWVHNGVVTAVQGENDDQTRAYVVKYLAAAHG